ncbi:MAG: arylesterase [Acidobacteriota bacterium]
MRAPLLILLALLASACSPPEEKASEAPSDQAPSPVGEAAPEPEEAPRNEIVVVFLGDSLTAGYGLDEDRAFPALVQERLRAEDYSVRVINGGVSGDTTAGGLQRVSWLLRQEPDVMMVALGGNDGLRGMDLDASQENLEGILRQVEDAGVKVLLAGMLIPPNYGENYTASFAAIYPRLAKTLGVPLLPFLLEGVAGDPELNQADGIHPTAAGQEILAGTVIEHLRPLIDQVIAEQASRADTEIRP